MWEGGRVGGSLVMSAEKVCGWGAGGVGERGHTCLTGNVTQRLLRESHQSCVLPLCCSVALLLLLLLLLLLSSRSLASKLSKKMTQLQKAELAAAVKEDLKTVALGTSKINYMDPRITIAWCKRNEVGGG